MGTYHRSEEASLVFAGRVKHATDKAALIKVIDEDMHNVGEEIWIPRSQLMAGSICETDAEGSVRVTRWWAQKKGLCE